MRVFIGAHSIQMSRKEGKIFLCLSRYIGWGSAACRAGTLERDYLLKFHGTKPYKARFPDYIAIFYNGSFVFVFGT